MEAEFGSSWRPSVLRSNVFGDEVFNKGLELGSSLSGPFQDIFVFSGVWHIAIGDVGNYGKGEDRDTVLHREDRFGDGAHSDHIGPHTSERAVFRSGLIIRA